jgi:hypothetical protein
VQQVCPNDASDHLAMGSYDPVGYALAVDAFSHESLAQPMDVKPAVCAHPFQPGVDPARFPFDYGALLAAIGNAQESAKQLAAEPRLACYVLARCRAGSPRRSR